MIVVVCVCVWQTTAPAGSLCSPHRSASAADIQSHMEKYLVHDAAAPPPPPPPLRLTARPPAPAADYRRDDSDDDDDDDGGGDSAGGRVTPGRHPHDMASLHAAAASLDDVKPLHVLNSDGNQPPSGQLLL